MAGIEAFIQEIRKKINYLNYDGFYDDYLKKMVDIDFSVKPWFAFFFRRSSTTLSGKKILFHYQFRQWSLNHQTDNCLHEVAHAFQYDQGRLSALEYIKDSQKQFEIEKEANIQNVIFRVRNGEISKEQINSAGPNNPAYTRALDAAKEIDKQYDSKFVQNLFVFYRNIAMNHFRE